MLALDGRLYHLSVDGSKMWWSNVMIPVVPVDVNPHNVSEILSSWSVDRAHSECMCMWQGSPDSSWRVFSMALSATVCAGFLVLGGCGKGRWFLLLPI